MDLRLKLPRLAYGLVVDYRSGGSSATERVQNGDFASATGWDTSGVAWVIALGVASNAIVGQFLTNAISPSPISAGASVTASVTISSNPNAVTWMLSFYNTSTLAAQNLLTDGSGAPGVYSTGAPVVALADYDAIRIRAIGDIGLVVDEISVIA